jgi:hypothetical protein
MCIITLRLEVSLDEAAISPIAIRPYQGSRAGTTPRESEFYDQRILKTLTLRR